MTDTATVVPFPIKTKLVCSQCGSPGQGSCRCGAPYVSPGERAAEAVAANPEKSDRAIAEEIGVGSNTVRRARENSTAPHGAVGKRIGKDGKTRKMPLQSRRGKAPTLDTAREIVRDKVLANEAINREALHKQHPDISVGTWQRAVIAEEARVAFLNDLGIDPKTLSMSAQAKLAVAQRQMERKLNAEHAARFAQIDEEVRLRVVARGKEYLAWVKEREVEAEKTRQFYLECTSKYKWIYTVEEFQAILRCLHPDSRSSASETTLGKAFHLFNKRKPQLTGQR